MLLDEQIPSFTNIDDAQAYLERICDGTSIANVAYLGVTLNGSRSKEPIIISTYQSDWVNRYIDKRYVMVDPAIVNGLRGILPYDWNANRSHSTKLIKFFGEANEFGVYHNGISIPIRDAIGGRATFSINSSLPNNEWEDLKKEKLGKLTIFAYQFHLQITDLISHNKPVLKISLSPRETDILLWAAEGKTSWETATILGLAENTVAFYMRNITSKLRVSTKAQAVAVALRTGLLI